MSHTMSVKKIRKMGQRLTTALTPAPAKAPKVSSGETVFREAQRVIDTARRKFHKDATPHLAASRAHLAKAEATFRKAWLVHEKSLKAK